MSDGDANFLDVVNAPEFEAAWQKIVDEPLTYEEFLELPLPEGIAPDDLWGTFSLLKRCTGRISALTPWFKGVEQDLCWSYTPKSVERDLFELSTLTAPNSFLNLHVEARGLASSLFAENVVEEVASLARRDGLPVSESAIRTIWLHRRPPSNRNEMVIENAYRLFVEAERLAKKPYTSFFADDVHDAIAQGTEGASYLRKLHFNSEHYRMDRLGDPEFVAGAFHVCIGRANEAQTFRDIVFAMIELSDTLWDVDVWPEFNALTEFILRRVYFIRKGVPALSYIAFSSRDEMGLDGFSKMHERESSSTPAQGLDSTWLYAGQVKILLDGTKELIRQIQHVESEDARVKGKIDDISWLNPRQKSLLLLLRKNPQRIVTIRDYSTASKVVYATARQDLLELEQHGLLTKEKAERTFCYRLSSRISW